MFWRKNDNRDKNIMDSDSYERIIKRIAELTSRIDIFETKFKLLQTDVENLRGNFNRKLSGIAKEIQESTPKTETESFNNSYDVPFG